MSEYSYSETDPLGFGDITATVGVAARSPGLTLGLRVLLTAVGSRRAELVEWLPRLATEADQRAACRAAVEAEVARRAALIPKVEDP